MRYALLISYCPEASSLPLSSRLALRVIKTPDNDFIHNFQYSILCMLATRHSLAAAGGTLIMHLAKNIEAII
jgi:hypothetical protein